LRGRNVPLKAAYRVPLALLFSVDDYLETGKWLRRTDVLDLNPFRSIEPMVVNNGVLMSARPDTSCRHGDNWTINGERIIQHFYHLDSSPVVGSEPTNVDTMVDAIYGAQTYGAGAVPQG